MHYATALVYKGRYIDFDFIEAPDPRTAHRIARRHVLPEFRFEVGSVILATLTEEERFTHPCLPALDTLVADEAFCRIGNENETDIHNFVYQYFPGA